MFEHKLAYRYSNGEVEGFVGIALTNENKAKEKAIQKVKEKIRVIRDTRNEPDFDEKQLIVSLHDCTADEFLQIQQDWKLSK